MSASGKSRAPRSGRFALAATAFCLAAFPLAATNLPPATVSFLDGSFLRGEIEALNSDTLKWRHPNARQPIEFSTTNLNLVKLPVRPLAAVTNAGPVCRVRLASGDEFEGRLLSLDGERFEVETWFAGRLRGQRAGLASLTFANAGHAAYYEGPRMADEWKSSVAGAAVNRGMGDVGVFGGGNFIVQPRIRLAPVAPPPQPDLGFAAPAVNAAAKELAAKLKEQLEKLGDKVSPAVKQALENQIKAAEELAPKEPVKAAEPILPPQIPAPAQAPRFPVRTIRELVVPGAPNPVAPPPAPAVDPVAQAVKIEGSRALNKTAVAAGELPALPIPAPRDGETKPPARVSLEDLKAGTQPKATAEIMKLVVAAQRAENGADLINSDLVRIAVDAGLASKRALEDWFGEYKGAADLKGDAAKLARFRLHLIAESTLLGSRLLRNLVPGGGDAFADTLDKTRAQMVEAIANTAEAKAQGAAQAQALAEARGRVLGALRVNGENLALGAEGALAGRVAATANTNSAWIFRDGAYYTTGVGSLGRECQLPAKARIEFDLAWKGQPYFRFSFFTHGTDFDYNDGWQFYTSSAGYIYSMRRSGLGATSSTGARVPQMLTKSTVRLTFLVDTERETTVLLADGEKVHEWKGMGSPDNGTSIVFYNYNSSSRVRVSDIRIAPWDGRADRDAEPLGAPGTDPDKLVEVPPPDTAVVEFVNNDRATGALHGIRDGKLTLNTAGNKLEIPLTRAALISFPVNDAPALPQVEGVQVTLHRNERLTLALEKWDANEITAVSPVFGRLKLKPESVRQLRFNPSAPRGPVDEWNGP